MLPDQLGRDASPREPSDGFCVTVIVLAWLGVWILAMVAEDVTGWRW